jgi:RNA polymerase sigma factor (sigma-70 family)
VGVPVATELPVEPASDRRARFEALFGEHGKAVYAYARRRASAADADDVVSETFVVAWRRIEDIPANARPWLLAVARRVLANLDRSANRRGRLQRRLEALPTHPTTEPAGSADVVRRALERLSPAEREAITLLAWEGLTPDEAATVLGCTRSAMYLRLHRARKRLAAELAQVDEEQE